MRQDVLGRYERDAQNRILIDVAAGRTEDLYNNFDRSAPYVRRDLDQDLVDYLIDSARELPPEQPFAIRFTLASFPDEAKLSRIRRSINGFFVYLAELERQKLRGMMRKSLVLLGIGIVILFLAVWSGQLLGAEETVAGHVFAEGLMVAAWVSLWEALAVFLIEWFPRYRRIRLYSRLSTTELLFRSESGVTGR